MSEAREVFDRHMDAFNAHDMDAFLRALSPTCVFISPEGHAEGHDEIAWYVGQFMAAFPDAHAMVWEKMDCGDSVINEFTIFGTHKGPYLLPGGDIAEATGRPINLRICSVCNVEDGLIASHRLYFDQLELIYQLGRRVS